jgi:hypothetical protein
MRNIIGVLSMILVGILLLGGTFPGIAQSLVINSNELKPILRDSTQTQSGFKKQYLVPSNLEVDDLVFFDSNFPPGRWNVPGLDHIAIYLGNNTFVCTAKNKSTGVFAVNIVNYNALLGSGMLKNPRFARVANVTAEQRHNATEWALSRIGDLYQTWDPRKCADPNASLITANQWYCSEIVWAAYYHQGIDIDRNGWKRDFPSFFPIFSAVSPQDIYEDNDVIHFS